MFDVELEKESAINLEKQEIEEKTQLLNTKFSELEIEKKFLLLKLND